MGEVEWDVFEGLEVFVLGDMGSGPCMLWVWGGLWLCVVHTVCVCLMF